ncbi:DEAD/DEAH box helicase [Desulfuromonas sp. KJ2020]|uniref:DEAD/DEAH box helicase n=1 Tax=Desulfuromonas sp. KJ2020 TaxID=2919173 RepID=UPI00032348C6|nr:DEAD/DEAH box helicase [Desulfuromonas sp. KJ2020]MCP3177151.1 DEAD/DEAH box helicase [Desulfuromonas sp. KJ2020]
MKFTELNLPEPVLKGIEDVGFTELTAVQEESIPLALAGNDVAGQAQTGTGKTAAFLISLFTRLLQNEKRTGNNPRALILAPTRELVVQIWEDAKALGAHCPFVLQPIFGGVDYDKQRQALKDGVDIIIATPGRLIDYAKQRVFSLRQVEALVIDEADRMFDMGFIKDLRYILRQLPPFEKRQTFLFSATLSPRVMELAYEFMNLAEKVRIEPEQVTAERVEQIVYHVAQREKFPLLLGLLKKEAAADRVVVFVNTKREAEFLAARLKANDFKAAVISGDIPQNKRMRILKDFKEDRLNFLVATDVASRGLHIDGVTHVINYDLPQDAEDYVHRIGRTARAGAVGKAISFADEELVYHLAEIEEYIGHKVPSDFPVEADFVWDYKKAPPRKKAPVPERSARSGKSERPRHAPRRRKRKPGDKGAPPKG